MRKEQAIEGLSSIIRELDVLNLLRVLDFARALSNKQKTTNL